MTSRAPQGAPQTQDATSPVAAPVIVPSRLTHRPTSDIVVPSKPKGPVDLALSDYARGTLSPARHLLVETLIALNPDVALRVAPREDRAAATLNHVRAVPLSPSLIGDARRFVPSTISCAGK